MGAHELHETAEAIVADHKGILAADESTGTIKKRFDSIGVESTEENRRFYRQLLFTTPGMEEFVGGVIMYDETLRQATDDGTTFAELLASKGVVPGIKVDTGAHDLAGFPGEKVTEGLDGLRGRLEEYRELGARFAKWRAVITIGDGIPTGACIHANAHGLARYARAVSGGGDRADRRARGAHGRRQHDRALLRRHGAHVARGCSASSRVQKVDLHGTLLKPNMVISGKGCPQQATAERIAELTVDCFLNHVPAAVPGIVFLSGGQSEVEATENLNAINRVGGPWPLSFSYGRALQASALEAWGGDAGNTEVAQAAFVHRARMNALAAAGEWNAELEQPVAA